MLYMFDLHRIMCYNKCAVNPNPIAERGEDTVLIITYILLPIVTGVLANILYAYIRKRIRKWLNGRKK